MTRYNMNNCQVNNMSLFFNSGNGGPIPDGRYQILTQANRTLGANIQNPFVAQIPEILLQTPLNWNLSFSSTANAYTFDTFNINPIAEGFIASIGNRLALEESLGTFFTFDLISMENGAFNVFIRTLNNPSLYVGLSEGVEVDSIFIFTNQMNRVPFILHPVT